MRNGNIFFLIVAILFVVGCNSPSAESAYFHRNVVTNLANGQKMITMEKKYLGEWVEKNSKTIQIVTMTNLGEGYFTVVFLEVSPTIEK